jgi:glycosyltransferase involved in cell wall biosynthesis
LDIELSCGGKKIRVANKQQILFLSTLNGDAWGGSEVFWFTMALALAKQGHAVTVAWLDWPERAAKNEQLLQAGCTVIPLPNHRFATNPLQKILRKKKAAGILKKNILAKQYRQVIISQSGFEDITHAPFNALLGLLPHYILLYHNYNLQQRLSASRSAALQKWAGGADLNLGASQQIFDAMPQMAGFEMANTAILYNPIGFEPPTAPTAWPPLQQGQYVFAVLAQLDCRRKAQDVLINALAHPKWRERNWQLWLYGEGKDRGMLENLIQTNGLQDKIFLKGHTSNPKAVLAQMHVLLQLTHIDAMPIAVVEAMSMGRPCLVTKVGDMPQWVTDGFNGWLADAATVADIDDILERAWQLQHNWPQMGERAFATFAQKYPNPYEAYYTGIILNTSL